MADRDIERADGPDDGRTDKGRTDHGRTDEGTGEATGERPQPVPPWWAGTGKRGALAMVVLGGAVAAWIFLAPVVGLPWLPFLPDEPATGYYQAAKIAAIGLVILGTTLFGARGRADGADEGPERGTATERGTTAERGTTVESARETPSAHEAS